MAKYLVIVESPAKVKTIKKFLGANYDVEASNGHVRDFPKSQFGIDVDNDFEPKYITIRGKGELLAKLRKEAKKADKTIIDQYSKDSETKIESHTTTLVKDNNTYLILHDRKEYYVYEQNNVEQNILTDGIKEVVDKDFTTGEEKVKGKKYDYEEYNGSTMFMITNTLELNEADIKTRFYFDKNGNLTYIKTIYGEDEELLKVNLEKDVDDSIFEIPSDYAEN